MEGGLHKAEKTEFRECLSLIWRQPYVLRLAFSAGIGGLLFGYDTGVISGALLYIRDEFHEVDRKTFLQETIVSMAVAGAIVGAAIGGWMNDRFGRRLSIMFADVLFFIGAATMAAAPHYAVIIVGRIFVGLGVGMASMTSPLYISEASPKQIRGALVSTNGLLITGGQFASYLINLGFTQVPGTWRWMLGVAGIPAIIQFILMLLLPESPRWLFIKKREEEAKQILRKIYPVHEVEDEIQALKTSVEEETREEQGSWNNTVVRRGLAAGIICQVAQQLVGINAVMYYSPTIVQLAGFASNKTAMALSLITSGLNAVGTVISMCLVDRVGRKKLMVASLMGIIIFLGLLGGVFHAAAANSPAVGVAETASFGNLSCPDYKSSYYGGSKWDCVRCLKVSSECGFCGSSQGHLLPGACLVAPSSAGICRENRRSWYTRGCPSQFGWVALFGLGAFILCYAPGMGTVPWIVNSEIYPLRYRGIGGGIAAMANWAANLVVSQSFLSLTLTLGSSGTFLLFCGASVVSLVLICLFVPETMGLPFEEVETVLARSGQWCFEEMETSCGGSGALKMVEVAAVI